MGKKIKTIEQKMVNHNPIDGFKNGNLFLRIIPNVYTSYNTCKNLYYLKKFCSIS